MIGLAVAAAVGMLVTFVLVKGRAAKVITDLRRDYTALVSEERHLRGDCEQAVILEESAEAMHNQAEADVEKYQTELKELAAQIEEIEAALHKARNEDGAEPA